MFSKYISPDVIDNLRNKGYIIITSNNIVYNVTSLIDTHPGGNKAILDNIYKNNYNSFKYHSIKSQKKWNKYKIGVISRGCVIL
jgi:cytochrome b involved in lipid metabolism